MNKKHLFLLGMVLTLTGCNSQIKPLAPYEKVSDEMLHFESSDSDLDFFLNDYFKRHVGYVDNEGNDYAVNTLKAGLNTTNTFYQEWTSMSLNWFNSFDGLETDRLQGQMNRISTIPVDDYGYVWDDNDAVRANNAVVQDGLHSMGWPFPTSDDSDGKSKSFLFNGDSEEWTTNFDASVHYLASTEGILYGRNLEGLSSFEFTSKAYTSLRSIIPYYSPYLELDLRMFLINPEDVDDVYVWFTNSREESFTKDKCVSAKNIAAISYDFTNYYEHLLYFPMYANKYWGDSETSKISQLKIEIRAKEGKTLKGDVGLNSVRCDFDTRHVNNNGIYISALKNIYEFTGDNDYLKANITRARKALNFYMQMYDTSRKLLKSSYLVGHDGIRDSSFGSAEMIAHCLGNGYYDVLYTAEYDFQTNMYFYKALKDLAYLENACLENGIQVDKSASAIKTASRTNGFSTSSYSMNSQTLEAIANDVLRELRKDANKTDCVGFYNTETGRFGAGFDLNTKDFYDFGYTMWNMEAVYFGIADSKQSKSIMDWISGERIVESDKTDQSGAGNGNAKTTGVGGSTGSDIYYFEFAPRINTVNQNNPSLFNGYYESNHRSKSVFGYSQVQYGGAILYTSFYDIVCRIKQYGADNALKRLNGIEDWYKRIYENSLNSDRDWRKSTGTYYSYFYYDYYAKTNLKLQGGRYGSSQVGGSGMGLLGVESEFIESLLMLASVPIGFFGLTSVDSKTLGISPSMPEKLDYWRIENLAFNKVKYDLTIQSNGLRIDSVRGNAKDLKVNVELDAIKGKDCQVYVNGVLSTDFKVVNNKVVMILPLQNVTIEIR